MNGMEYNSDYIGVETIPMNGLKVSVKYTGNAEKNVILMEGQMASVGYINNSNGKINYITAIGIIKCIGCDPMPRSEYKDGYTAYRCLNFPANHQNPYWISLDCSTESNSDVKTIYIRDIRDITVGKAPVEPSTPEVSGYNLPTLTEANAGFYAGRLFFVNPKPIDPPPVFGMWPHHAPNKDHHHEPPKDQPGVYFCTGKEWIQLTAKCDVLSSPLVRPLDLVGRSDHLPMIDQFELNNKVLVGPKNQLRSMMALGGMVVQEYFNEDEHGINSTINLDGNTVTIRLSTTGLKKLYTEYTNICKIPKGYYPNYTGEVFTDNIYLDDGYVIGRSWYVDADGLWIKFNPYFDDENETDTNELSYEDIINHITDVSIHLSAEDRAKLDGVATVSEDIPSTDDSETTTDPGNKPEDPGTTDTPPVEDPGDKEPENPENPGTEEPEVDPIEQAFLERTKQMRFSYNI